MPKGTTVAVQTAKSRDSVQSTSFVFYRTVRFRRSHLSKLNNFVQFFENK